jgi:hypothetical protein
MEINYTDLLPATGAVMCYGCREYKGQMECPECAGTICVFCEDACENCDAVINFSA